MRPTCKSDLVKNLISIGVHLASLLSIILYCVLDTIFQKYIFNMIFPRIQNYWWNELLYLMDAWKNALKEPSTTADEPQNSDGEKVVSDEEQEKTASKPEKPHDVPEKSSDQLHSDETKKIGDLIEEIENFIIPHDI